MKWVDPKKTPWSCIDGRSSTDELGTPGGDSGEFLLMLGQLKNKINAAQVEGFLNGFIHSDRTSFYLHTNDKAEKTLLATLQSKYGKQKYPDTFDIARPTPSHYKELLQEVIKPEHIGCDHIKQLVLQPADYGVPLALTQAFIQAYFKGLWSDISRTKFEYRRHEYSHDSDSVHQEKNVLVMKMSENAAGMTQEDLNQLVVLAEKQTSLTLAKVANGVPMCHLRFTKYSTSQLVQAAGHWQSPVDIDNVPRV
eukprot:gene16327-19422_t